MHLFPLWITHIFCSFSYWMVVLQLTFERSLSINYVSLCDELQLFFPPTCFSFIFVLGIFLPCRYLLCLCGPAHQGFHSWFLGFVFVEGILSRGQLYLAVRRSPMTLMWWQTNGVWPEARRSCSPDLGENRNSESRIWVEVGKLWEASGAGRFPGGKRNHHWVQGML